MWKHSVTCESREAIISIAPAGGGICPPLSVPHPVISRTPLHSQLPEQKCAAARERGSGSSVLRRRTPSRLGGGILSSRRSLPETCELAGAGQAVSLIRSLAQMNVPLLLMASRWVRFAGHQTLEMWVPAFVGCCDCHTAWLHFLWFSLWWSSSPGAQW